jgi:hypothetical protein
MKTLYNIFVLTTILLMATTLKPTLSLWTPPAQATPTPTPTTSTTSSTSGSGKSIEQIQDEAEAKRQAKKAPAVSFTAPIPTPTSSTNVGGPAYFNPKTPGVAYTSLDAANSWTVTPWNTIAKTTTTAPTPTPKATSLRSDAINYRSALTLSKWDKKVYASSIGYDKLSANQKKIADGIFEASTKKKNINKPTVSVVRYEDNPDGTTTNYLSDGTTSIVKYTKNPDGSLKPNEVFKPTWPALETPPAAPEKTRAELGLKTITPSWVLKKVPTIAELIASGLTPQKAIEARRQAIKDNSAPKVWELSDITQKNIYDKAQEMNLLATTDAKTGTMSDLELQKKTEKKSYEMMDTYFEEEWTNIDTLTNEYVASLQAAQSGYESNRMNQVRGQLIQSLAARGIDISNVPPEQLIALSGEIGVTAFNDVYEQKVAMQDKINAAKEKALTQLRELRAKDLLNEDTYNRNVTNLTVAANAKNRELDVAFNNTFLGIAEKKLGQTDVAQATALNVLTQAGINPTIMGDILTKVQGAANANEANKIVYDWLSTPAGKKAYQDAVTAKNSAAEAENKFKTLEMEANNKYRAGLLTNDTAKMFQQLSDQYAKLAQDPTLQSQKDANAALATKYANMATGIITWTPWASASTGSPWQWSPN